MAVEAGLAMLLILLGPAAGSFLAVLVDRLPRDKSIVTRRMSCSTCKAPIPILSFAVQRGRCRRCTAVIPSWIFYMELLCLGGSVLAVLKGGPPLQVMLSALFLWLLVALAMADLRWFRLFDILTGTLAVVAFGMTVAGYGPGLLPALWGSVLGAGSFAALRRGYFALRGREGLGMGDVKLMVGLGAFAGPYDLPLLVLLAALAALGVALAQRLGDAASLASDRPLPFGTALCAAAAALWLIGPQLTPTPW